MWNNEESDEEDRTDHASLAASALAAYSSRYAPSDREDEEDSEEDDDDDNNDDDDGEEAVVYEDENDNDASREDFEESPSYSTAEPSARGKPEAMAVALAAAVIQEKREELEAEKDAQEEVAVVAEPVVVDEGDSEEKQQKPAPKAKKKRNPPKKAKTPELLGPSIDDPVPDITDIDYENLKELMTQFCRVPLLAEFSRPVTLLHPELISAYSKIVSHPVDLGKVCRSLARRDYTNTRDFRLDMWRIFANCVKYHSHPSNKEAVPSFVSIALHLRDYFNSLWQEYMLPSDSPQNVKTPYIKAAYQRRDEDRKKRLSVSGLSVMGAKCLDWVAEEITTFISNQGCVCKLDVDPIFDTDEEDDARDLDTIVENLQRLKAKLEDITTNGQDYLVDDFDRDMRNCYVSSELFENNPALRKRVANRFGRFIGRKVIPIHEANCRGVTQSSIWGCMAAAIWARDTQKKPYWPALVLGILAPADQREDWHEALTERNEIRLPEKLRSQLLQGKRKAQQNLKKHALGQAEPQSYFLVEFMGTHEFIWVKESDMVENFDAGEDPNVTVMATKKKRASRSNTANVLGSKMYASAIEEAKWALEEFEMQLQDASGDSPEEGEEDDQGEEMNYSYSFLCQSDDEADAAFTKSVKSEEESVSDLEEINELLATEGLLDFSAAGRKNAKKRAQLLKKQKADAEKKEKAELAKKAKAAQAKKRKDMKRRESEEKKERELEKRRKKRIREREQQAMKAKSSKKRRMPEEQAPPGDLSFNKRARATAIVKAYLTRMSKNEDYRNLGLSGILTIPASMVDSSGLLGMALAFRASAGELPMPGETGDHEVKVAADAIQVDGIKDPEERIQNLERQVELLMSDIERVKATTARRRELQQVALDIQTKRDRESVEDDIVARRNNYKKRKKSISKADPTTPDDDSPQKQEEKGEVDEVASADDDDVQEAEAIPTGETSMDWAEDSEVVEATTEVQYDD